MSPTERQVTRLILNNELAEARHLLESWHPTSHSEKRAHQHLWGRIDMQAADFAAARTLFQSARNKYGDNLCLLRDLMVCHYHLQEMEDFRRIFAEIETLWLQLKDKLNVDTSLETALILGKFCEEEARIGAARIYYEEALALTSNLPQRIRVLVQKGRWLALFNPNDELGEIYRQLISTPSTNLTDDLKIEREHSLMLMELQLVGRSHAWMRVERIFNQLDEHDARLMVFDFIELSLAKGDPIAAAVLHVTQQFKILDPFEEFISSHIEGRLSDTDRLSKLADLASMISWSCHLRLLCLSANFSQSKDAREAYFRQIELILSSLDPSSQGLWKNQLNILLQSPEIKAELSLKTSELLVQGKAVELRKKRTSLILLEALAKNPIISVDEAIRTLWQSDFSPDHYHRLRMAVHRLNTLIHESTAAGKMIEVNAERVQVKPGVSLVLNLDFGGGHNQKRRCEASVLQQGVLPSIAPPHN